MLEPARGRRSTAIVALGRGDVAIERSGRGLKVARVNFTQAIQRHIAVPAMEVSGRTVREVLQAVFEVHAQARGYVLDDQGMLRQHMVVFVDGEPIEDRDGQSDPVGPNAEVFVMQALSGG